MGHCKPTSLAEDFSMIIFEKATEERYHNLPSFYWRDAIGALLVYDITK